MNSLVKICSVTDVAPGGMKSFILPELPEAVAVFNLDGTIYVTNDECTHFVASLTEGYFEGEVVECPLHGGSFNIKTGAPMSRPCEIPLQTYQVVLEAGNVYIKNETQENRLSCNLGKETT
jgi:nitrite reductase/ring-hydroxylating ferredoxin subunit